MEQMRIEERVTEIKCRCKEKIIYCSRMFRFHSNYLIIYARSYRSETLLQLNPSFLT